MLDWTVVVSMLVAVAVAAGFGVVVWARTRQPPATDSRLLTWVAVCVRAADQLFPGDDAARLEYAIDRMQRLYPRLDAELVRTLVEGAVREWRVLRGFQRAAPVSHRQDDDEN